MIYMDANLEAKFVKLTFCLIYLFSFNTKNNAVNGS